MPIDRPAAAPHTAARAAAARPTAAPSAVAAAEPPDRLCDRPLYALLVQFPVVCFVGAFLADIVYWRDPLYQWETFSVWLLAFGCIMAGITGVVGLVVFIGDRRARLWRLAWPHALLSLLAALLAVVNAFVHSRDGYTAVVPDGLTLSALVVVLMLLVAAMSWTRRPRPARAFRANDPTGAAGTA